MSVRFPIDHMKSYARNLLKHILKLSRPWVLLSQYTFFWENILVLTHFDQMNNPQSLLESYGSQLFLTICHNPRFLIPTKAVRILLTRLQRLLHSYSNRVLCGHWDSVSPLDTLVGTPALISNRVLCGHCDTGQCLSSGHTWTLNTQHMQKSDGRGKQVNDKQHKWT